MKGKKFEICGEIKSAELVIIGKIPYVRFMMKRLDGIYMLGLTSKNFQNVIVGRTVTVTGSYTWHKHPRYGREYMLMCCDVYFRHNQQALRRIG